MRPDCSVLLLGMMGAGKSTLARLLAAELEMPLVVLDEMVVAMAGKQIPAIFADDGEQVFRDYETRALGEALRMHNVVVDTGGGVVDSKVNREAIARTDALRLFLTAGTGLLARRVGQARGRPMLAGKDIDAELAAIATRRDKLYREVATSVVEMAPGETPEQTAGAIIEMLGK